MSTALRVAFSLLVGIALVNQPASAKRGSNVKSVTVIASGNEAASLSVAADLAEVLDEGSELRVLPIIGRGPVQSLTDLLYLKGVDAAVVPADALAYAERHDLMRGTSKKLRYVAKLGASDVHIVVRAGITSLTELKGRKVDVGLTVEERFAGASLLFETLRIDVEAAAGPESLALDRLKRGEIEAAVLLGRKPLAALAEITPKDNLTLLPVPPHADLARVYAPQIFDGKDYPGLIDGNDMVESLSVGTVLAVFDWPNGTEGFGKLEALTTNLYHNSALLQEGARRAQWHDINLAASVPGWTRYAPAENWMKAGEPAVAAQPARNLKGEFTAFVARAGKAEKGGEEALFARFLDWRKKTRQ